MAGGERHYSDYELSKPAGALARRFIQRWDLFAMQLEDGGYICIHEPLNVSHLMAHLRGEITLGTYLLDEDSRARYIVYDADDEHGLERLTYLRERLANEDIPSYLEASRRGGHLWLFFGQAVPGKAARRFGRGLLDHHGFSGVEVFPKQDILGGGPGSLIRLPFGTHRLSGRRYGFVDTQRNPLAPTIREQIDLLERPEVVPGWTFEAYTSMLPALREPPMIQLEVGETELVSEKIKASTNLSDFIGAFVELSTTSSGAIGLCPFHNDHQPSLSVNDEGNYWYCFAGCGGGSIIDFWMKWRGCDFQTALRELGKKLLH